MTIYYSLAFLILLLLGGVFLFREIKKIKEIREQSLEGSPYDFQSLPSLAYSHFETAMNLTTQEKFAEAIIDLQAANKLAPHHKGLTFYLAAAYVQVAQYEAAESIIKLLQKNNPVDNFALYLQGAILHKQGDFDKALQIYDKALYHKLYFASPYLNRALILLEKGNLDRAKADIERAKSIEPKNPNVWDFEGKLKVAQRLHQEAIDAFEKSLAINPENVENLLNLSAAYLDLRQYEPTIDYANRALKLNPHDARAYNNRGYSKFRLNNNDEALVDLAKAIELSPTTALYYHNYSSVLIAQKRFQESYEISSKGIEQNPQDYFSYVNRATSLKALRRFPEAFEDLDRAVAINSAFPAAYYVKGSVYAAMNEADKAFHFFDKALELGFNSPYLFNIRAWIKAYSGDYTGSLADAEQAIAINAEIPSFYDTRAQTKWLLDDFSGALADFQEAINRADKALSIYQLGKAAALYKLGREEESLNLWRETKPEAIETLEEEYRFAPPYYQCLLELEKRSLANG